MSAFAANLASVARSKLHSSLVNGSKGEVSLHRWVLLKNSIIRDDVPLSPTSLSTSAAGPPVEEVEDEEVDTLMDDDMFAFLFPDPGDALGEDDASASEAQWLDSLLETLGDDSDDDVDIPVKVSIVSETDVDHSQTDVSSPRLADKLFSPQPLAVPYPVPYPPFHPPLVHSLELDSQQHLYSGRDYSPYHHHIDDSYLSMPDAIEDTSDDESTESPSTPFTRSRSSLSLVDPASIPLPSERTSARPEPHVYGSADVFYTFENFSLPFPDVLEDTDSSPVYGPLFQNC